MFKKYLLLFFVLILFITSSSTVKKVNEEIKLFHRVIDNDTTTLITNLNKIDTISIKGKWFRIRFTDYKSHGIQLINNDTLLSFTPYPKKISGHYNKKLTNEQFFKIDESRIEGFWRKINSSYRKIKEGTDYSVYYLSDKYTLLGAKGDNTFYIIYFTPDKRTEQSKVNYLINFFNSIK